MCLVSIIAPVYNVEGYLQRSIDSIRNQSFIDWELILVNDGSTDGSLTICELNRKRDSRIKIINQKNSGSGVARNSGLKKANGKYICFLDPDDYLDSNAILENVKLMEKSSVDLIVNGYREIEKNIEGHVIIKEKRLDMNGEFNFNEFRYRFNEFEKISPRPIWNKMYKKTFLERNRIEFPHQRIGQDAVFNCQVYGALTNILINDNIYYNYDRTREGSAVKTYNDKRFLFDINIVKSYKMLFLNWNLSNFYEQSLNRKYLDAVMNEIRNINLNDSSLNLIERDKRLHNIINSPEIANSIKNTPYSEMKNVKTKSILFLLKTKRIRLLNLLFRKLEK